MCNPLRDAIRRKMICLFAFVLLVALNSNAPAGFLDDSDLVFYYSFDSVTDIVADQSGNGHDGVVNGDVTAEPVGKYGGAARFASTSFLDLDGENFPVEEVPTAAITLAAWIKVENTGDHHAIFNARSSHPVWLIHPEARSNGEFRWLLRSAGNSTIFDIRAGVVTWDEWLHFAGTYDKASGKANLYINGEMVREENISNPEDIAGDWVSGARVGYNIDAARPFTGLMDDLLMFRRALSLAEVNKLMQGIGSPMPFGPNPADGSIHTDTWANITWFPGDKAASHDVYFSDNFDAVNEGAAEAFQGNQTTTFVVVGFPGFLYPDGLVPGTTYYWRIDEVNDTEPNSPWRGPVWSFMVPPKTAYSPIPADGTESVEPDAELSWTAGFGAKLHTVYFGDDYDQVNNASDGGSQGPTTYTPGQLESGKVYYWRVDEFDAVDTYKGDVWSFSTPGAVGSLSPANGATDVNQELVIEWIAAEDAASHDLYLGVDKDAVRSADKSAPEYKGTMTLGTELYDAGSLEWDTTFYWRVDAVMADGSAQKGLIWSFTTANFLVVDDFESYNDLNEDEPGSNRIYLAWIDGLEDPSNGSIVGYENPPFAEQKIVHGGSQSMPLAYDNSVGYSEATKTLTELRDWTVNDVGILTIWFKGDTTNAAETMYVALNGVVVSNDNPAAVQSSIWTQWDVDLQAFANQGVNLANVDTISLGFGNKSNPQAGGSGMVFIDDIRLYPRPPVGDIVLKLDVGNSNNSEELEDGFTSFTIADNGSQVDGVTVEIGGTLDSRRRGEPAGVPFEQIYRDFVFSRPGEMTITLSGLAPDTTYEIKIYAWDISSAETRVADWTANGEFLCKTEFDGAQNPPAAEDDYAFSGKATSDSTGTIFLESAPGEGTREPSGENHPFAFLNALVLVPAEP